MPDSEPLVIFLFPLYNATTLLVKQRSSWHLAAAAVGSAALSFGVEYLGFTGALISFAAFCLLMANRSSRAEVSPAPPPQAYPKGGSPDGVKGL